MTDFMEGALEQARAAAVRGEVPVGAVLVAPSGEVLAMFGNETRARNDCTAHAELLCIREASQKLGSERLENCDLYITLEPCAMCAAAISFARIRKLIFGAYDPKSGGVEHGGRFFTQPTCHWKPEVIGGVREAECGEILRNFFNRQRNDASFFAKIWGE